MAHVDRLSFSPEENDILAHYTREHPIRVGGLAKDLGVKVKISALDTGISGQISRENGQYIIRVNRYESRERQRFTIAHELAHYLLHRDIIDASSGGICDNILYRSGQPEAIEVEANALGAEILMPSALIEQRLRCTMSPAIDTGTPLHANDITLTEDDVLSLAEDFQVSKVAMDFRLSSLRYK